MENRRIKEKKNRQKFEHNPPRPRYGPPGPMSLGGPKKIGGGGAHFTTKPANGLVHKRWRLAISCQVTRMYSWAFLGTDALSA